MCFYEFSKIKEDKKVCEVNCGKIEDKITFIIIYVEIMKKI